jgi:carbon starvation protein
MWILFFYILIASSIPVKVLLQPRDYINSWLLYAGIAIGFIAAVFAFRGFEVPAFASFSPIIVGGKPTPFWPAILLVVAFSSISGFHSLVASGTTSKQLEKESDALWVGYGAMLAQGFFSTIVIVAIAGFGYTALLQEGITTDVLNYKNWGAMYAEACAQAGLSHVNLFIKSYAAMVKATWLKIIPEHWIIVFAGIWIASFVMSALDTTNRVARYCFTEMALPLRNKFPIFKLLTNRWIASIIPAALGICFAVCINDFLIDTSFKNDNWWLILWSSLGLINHLVASIALLTGASYVAKIMKSSFSYAAMIPAWILWITVTAALIWFFITIQPVVMSSNLKAGWGMAFMLVILCILNFIYIADFIKSRSYRA